MKIKNLLNSGLIAGMIVAAINVIIYTLFKRLGIINNEILLPNGKPLLLLPVVISSILPAIVAAVVLWGISKKSANPVKVFTFVGVLLLLFSLIGPVAMPNLTIGFKIALLLMHVIASSVIIYILSRNFIRYKDAATL